jgi:uncharacterized membrane-anchored protein YhcB (DUF1043 family)
MLQFLTTSWDFLVKAFVAGVFISFIWGLNKLRLSGKSPEVEKILRDSQHNLDIQRDEEV